MTVRTITVIVDTDEDINVKTLTKWIKNCSAHLNVKVEDTAHDMIEIINGPVYSDVELNAKTYKMLQEFGKKRGLEPMEVINGGARRLGEIK